MELEEEWDVDATVGSWQMSIFTFEIPHLPGALALADDLRSRLLPLHLDLPFTCSMTFRHKSPSGQEARNSKTSLLAFAGFSEFTGRSGGSRASYQAPELGHMNGKRG